MNVSLRQFAIGCKFLRRDAEPVEGLLAPLHMTLVSPEFCRVGGSVIAKFPGKTVHSTSTASQFNYPASSAECHLSFMIVPTPPTNWPDTSYSYNDEYAPPGWNYERDGKPDVVFMRHVGGDTAYVEGSGKLYDDYDAAKADGRAEGVDKSVATASAGDGRGHAQGYWGGRIHQEIRHAQGADGILSRLFGLIRKYSADQARDDHGRWTSGGSQPGTIDDEKFKRDLADEQKILEAHNEPTYRIQSFMPPIQPSPRLARLTVFTEHPTKPLILRRVKFLAIRLRMRFR